MSVEKPEELMTEAELEAKHYAELQAELSASYRTEILLSATPEQFRKLWVNL